MNTAPKLKVVPKQEDVIKGEIQAIADSATSKDIARAAEIAASGKGLRKESVSSVVAAVLFTKHNHHNRPLNIFKIQAYRRKMTCGAWSYTHQAVAFYSD